MFFFSLADIFEVFLFFFVSDKSNFLFSFSNISANYCFCWVVSQSIFLNLVLSEIIDIFFYFL